MQYLTQTEFSSGAEFVKAINALRLQNKNNWFAFNGIVQGQSVQFKSYGHTYMQIFKVEGISLNVSPMDCKVSDWKKVLEKAFN